MLSNWRRSNCSFRIRGAQLLHKTANSIQPNDVPPCCFKGFMNSPQYSFHVGPTTGFFLKWSMLKLLVYHASHARVLPLSFYWFQRSITYIKLLVKPLENILFSKLSLQVDTIGWNRLRTCSHTKWPRLVSSALWIDLGTRPGVVLALCIGPTVAILLDAFNSTVRPQHHRFTVRTGESPTSSRSSSNRMVSYSSQFY